MRLRLGICLLALSGCLFFASLPALAYDLFPSRYALTGTTTDILAPNAEYSVCIYRPDSVTLDNYVFVTTTSTPNLAGHWSNLVIWNQDGRVTDQMNFFYKAKYVAGRDVDGDGTQELVVSFAGDTACGVAIYEWPDRKLLSEFTMPERDYRWRDSKLWETTMSIGPVVRETDSTLLLLMGVGAGHGKMPKGILAIDPRTGQEAWHYWIAGDGILEQGELIESPVLEKPLFVFGTYCSANGSVWNGTEDTKAYMGALDESGHEVWRWERPGPFTGMDFRFAFVENNTQTPLVFTLYRCVGSDAPAESLFCVDAATGAVVRHAVVAIGGGDSRCVPWNPSPEGKHQFLVYNRRAGIGVFDEELKLIWHQPKYEHVLATEDFDRDGKLELVVQGRTKETVLLDDDFTRLASYPIFASDGRARFQWTNGMEYPYLFVLDADHVVRFSLNKTPYYWLQITSRLIGMLLLGTLAVWIVVWGTRARVAAIRARREREQTQAWAAMASKLAHDIRTPVSVMQLSGRNLEMELEQEYGNVPDHIRKYFDVFRREASRTENAARSMLKFARVEKPVLESVDLGKLLKETVDSYPHSSDLRLVHDIAADLPLVSLDRQQIISLIENLVSNAVKAMKGKGTLTARLRKAQLLPSKGKAQGALELTIEDTGCGIPADELTRVFEPYFSHADGGTGLGLPIVKKIVEDHHGTIQLESEPGTGTKVRVCIPLDPRSADV